MPNIVVEGPVIKELEKKRTLVREITEVAKKVYGLPGETITVVIKENPPEKVALGGELIIDRHR